MFGFGLTTTKSLSSNLFGKFIVKHRKVHLEHAQKLLKCLQLIESGLDRYSDGQRKVFKSVSYIVINGRDEADCQACASQATRTIRVNVSAIKKNGKGGLTWLLCHEMYHLWNPYLSIHSHARVEANANLFANRIKNALESKPALYVWK